MELVNMQLPKKTKKELKETYYPSVSSQELFPYGLKLSFETEQIEKIPSLADFKIGDRVAIQAEACITSIRMSEQQDKEVSRTVEMQIEEIACEPLAKKSIKEMSPKEYRKARETKSI